MATTLRSMMLLGCAALAVSIAGCDSSTSPAPGDGGTDAGSDAGTDAGPTCYANPMNDFQIENACTDAGFIDKTPNLPLLLSDGGLPPLP